RLEQGRPLPLVRPDIGDGGTGRVRVAAPPAKAPGAQSRDLFALESAGGSRGPPDVRGGPRARGGMGAREERRTATGGAAMNEPPLDAKAIAAIIIKITGLVMLVV